MLGKHSSTVNRISFFPHPLYLLTSIKLLFTHISTHKWNDIDTLTAALRPDFKKIHTSFTWSRNCVFSITKSWHFSSKLATFLPREVFIWANSSRTSASRFRTVARRFSSSVTWWKEIFIHYLIILGSCKNLNLPRSFGNKNLRITFYLRLRGCSSIT